MKRAIRFTTLFICGSLALILLTPMVLALTRRTHLENFIDSAKTPSGGYQTTALPNNITAGTPDLESTTYAISMSFVFGKSNEDFIDTTNWIIDNMKTAGNGFRLFLSDTTATMAGMFYASMALNATSKLSLGDGPRLWIEARRNTTSGGFDTQEGGITTTLATYYALESLYQLNNYSTILAYRNNIQGYFLACYNSVDGGFADIIGQASTLESTWAAVAGLYRLKQFTGYSLPTADITKTLQYVSQFYFSTESDTFNYGGYGTSARATVRDTFYAQMTYFLLGSINPNKDAVEDYLLSCQNIVDGGFAEKTQNSNYGTSSMVTTFFAFEALETFDNKLEMLNVEVWFLPFDYVSLIVIIAIVIVVLAFAVHYYRKRHD